MIRFIILSLTVFVFSSCAGFPVFRCAFDTRPDDLGMGECWDNQKRAEYRPCFDNWKDHGTYKACIANAETTAPKDIESKPEIELTDENGIKDCKFTGTFRGIGGGSSARSRSMDGAKTKAIANGSTHYYLKDFKTEKHDYTDDEVTAAYIKAYDCSARSVAK